jgi:xanthine dehydrogenase accessory factor
VRSACDVASTLVVVRGGGDLATGVVWRLTRAGFPVVVSELAAPLTVRRTVAVSTAVTEGSVIVEGLEARRATTPDEAAALARSGVVGVVVSSGLPALGAPVVVDARLAKRNLDTSLDDAGLVVALGPGFTAGVDCHAVVETMRGHHLGRVLTEGSAAPNTGTPGVVAGRGAERVLRSPVDGSVIWTVAIGDRVEAGHHLGTVGGTGAEVTITAPFEGVVRGLIHPGVAVRAGLKIGDVDPRCDPAACHEISDKALAVGGGVLEAVMHWCTSSN